MPYVVVVSHSGSFSRVASLSSSSSSSAGRPRAQSGDSGRASISGGSLSSSSRGETLGYNRSRVSEEFFERSGSSGEDRQLAPRGRGQGLLLRRHPGPDGPSSGDWNPPGSSPSRSRAPVRGQSFRGRRSRPPSRRRRFPEPPLRSFAPVRGGHWGSISAGEGTPLSPPPPK